MPPSLEHNQGFELKDPPPQSLGVSGVTQPPVGGVPQPRHGPLLSSLSSLADGKLGTETMDKMRALHTPLQQITVGSGLRLSTHTWPT